MSQNSFSSPAKLFVLSEHGFLIVTVPTENIFRSQLRSRKCLLVSDVLSDGIAIHGTDVGAQKRLTPKTLLRETVWYKKETLASLSDLGRPGSANLSVSPSRSSNFDILFQPCDNFYPPMTKLSLVFVRVLSNVKKRTKVAKTNKLNCTILLSNPALLKGNRSTCSKLSASW